MLLFMSSEMSRIKILGKKSTHNEVALYIKRLVFGNPRKNLPGVGKTEIARQLQTSRPTIDKYLKLAENITEDSKEIIRAPKQLSSDFESFVNDELIQKWKAIMLTRARGGKPNQGYNHLIRAFYGVCRTLDVHPQTFLTGVTDDEVLENGRTMMNNFMDLYKEKKAKIIYRKNWSAEDVDLQQIAYAYSKAVRDFMRSNHFVYPVGESGNMSQSITAFHGKYADVRMDEETHLNIKQDFIDDFGIDSDEFRFYMIGIEAFPRHSSIISMPSQFSEFTIKDNIIFDCHVIETKTSQYKGGKWTKHIFDQELQDSIRKVNIRNSPTMIEKGDSAFHVKIIEYLKKEYTKYNLHLTALNKGKPDTSYFIKRPAHVLRHCGAQRILKRTNWNIGYVAKRGWKTPAELVASYGEMTAEQEMKTLESIF